MLIDQSSNWHTGNGCPCADEFWARAWTNLLQSKRAKPGIIKWKKICEDRDYGIKKQGTVQRTQSKTYTAQKNIYLQTTKPKP